MKWRDQAGFTLLETLVTLVVLGFLVGGLVQGLKAGVTSWQAQSRALAARGDLDAAERTLRALVARTDPGGFSRERPTFQGNAHSLLFTTSLPQAASRLPTREADVTLAVDNRRRLALLWQPHYRNRIGSSPPPENVTLLDDVDHLELAYWQDAATGWQVDWAGRDLPKLVRIRVVFTPASRRFAPDIVIRTMRDRWRQ